MTRHIDSEISRHTTVQNPCFYILPLGLEINGSRHLLCLLLSSKGLATQMNVYNLHKMTSKVAVLGKYTEWGLTTVDTLV